MTSRQNQRVGGVEKPLILHVRVATGAGGGPEKTILNSPRFLGDLGYDCLCAYLRPPNDDQFAVIRSRATALSAPLEEIDDRGPLDLGVVRRLLRLCRERRVAVWHGHDYKSNSLGLLLRRFWPMKLVTTVHGWGERTWRTPLYYHIDRCCLRRYERVISVSHDLHAQCRSLGISEQRCLLIENAIDVDQFRRTGSPAAARRRLGLPEGRLLVGAVGRLSEEKGFDRLISAVDQLVREGLDVGLVIAGDGRMREPLEALIEKLNRQDRICLLGFCDKPQRLYEAIDVFALSSLREGLPNALLEAMALQTPAVCTSVAGIPRLVRDGENGRLVPPDDVPALAKALRELLQNEPVRRQMAQQARRDIETKYTFSARMKRISSMYDDVLRAADARPRAAPSEQRA